MKPRIRFCAKTSDYDEFIVNGWWKVRCKRGWSTTERLYWFNVYMAIKKAIETESHIIWGEW